MGKMFSIMIPTKQLKVGGSLSHGIGFRFSFWLHFLSMIPRFVEALLEFSRRLCKVYLSWFHFTLRLFIAKEVITGCKRRLKGKDTGKEAYS